MKYNNTIIACDWETGGLPNKKLKAFFDVPVTEFAMVCVDNEKLEIVSEQSWLIKPYSDELVYNSIAADVSGITKKMCEESGEDVEAVYKKIKAVLKKAKKGSRKPIVVFHNKKFDVPFLENMFITFDDDIHKYIERFDCTLEKSREKWVEKPNFKLASVASYCNIDTPQTHRALPDTIITAKVLIYLLKCLRSDIDEQEEDKEKFRETFKF